MRCQIRKRPFQSIKNIQQLSQSPSNNWFDHDKWHSHRMWFSAADKTTGQLAATHDCQPVIFCHTLQRTHCATAAARRIALLRIRHTWNTSHTHTYTYIKSVKYWKILVHATKLIKFVTNNCKRRALHSMGGLRLLWLHVVALTPFFSSAVVVAVAVVVDIVMVTQETVSRFTFMSHYPPPPSAA